jgi:SHS2 domain-containing protein
VISTSNGTSAERGGTYRIVGRGSDMAIEVTGPTAEACLAAAIEGFAAALAEVDPSVDRRREPITLPGAAPADLLVDLIDDAILRLDADGALAVGLTDAQVDDDGLRGALEIVNLADARVHGAAPKAATWHGARLERTSDGWEGHVMLDL